LQLVRVTGPTEILQTRDGGQTVELAPVMELRPGEVLEPFRVEVRGVRLGEQTLRVEARSGRSPSGVTAEISTAVVQ